MPISQTHVCTIIGFDWPNVSSVSRPRRAERSRPAASPTHDAVVAGGQVDAIVNGPAGGLAARQRPMAAPVVRRDDDSLITKRRKHCRWELGIEGIEIDRGLRFVLVQAHPVNGRHAAGFHLVSLLRGIERKRELPLLAVQERISTMLGGNTSNG